MILYALLPTNIFKNVEEVRIDTSRLEHFGFSTEVKDLENLSFPESHSLFVVDMSSWELAQAAWSAARGDVWTKYKIRFVSRYLSKEN